MLSHDQLSGVQTGQPRNMRIWDLHSTVMTVTLRATQKINERPLLLWTINKAIMSIISRQQSPFKYLGCLGASHRGQHQDSVSNPTANADSSTLDARYVGKEKRDGPSEMTKLF